MDGTDGTVHGHQFAQVRVAEHLSLCTVEAARLARTVACGLGNSGHWQGRPAPPLRGVRRDLVASRQTVAPGEIGRVTRPPPGPLFYKVGTSPPLAHCKLATINRLAQFQSKRPLQANVLETALRLSPVITQIPPRTGRTKIFQAAPCSQRYKQPITNLSHHAIAPISRRSHYASHGFTITQTHPKNLSNWTTWTPQNNVANE